MAKRNRSNFERLQRGERLSRRERKQIERQLQAKDPGWEILHHNLAGIDVGNESHFVAVDARKADQPVREFGFRDRRCGSVPKSIMRCCTKSIAHR
jgi:hypothetical protein